MDALRFFLGHASAYQNLSRRRVLGFHFQHFLLARLVCAIDGQGPLPDILSGESVRQMTTWFDPDTYSLGWNDTKPTGEWTRSGSFSGTQALVKVYPDGECWILISNTSAWRGSRFSNNIAVLFQDLRSRFSSQLPQRDLFVEPGN